MRHYNDEIMNKAQEIIKNKNLSDYEIDILKEEFILSIGGILFKNEYKENDRQPDFVGSLSYIISKNKCFKVSAWKNKSKLGSSYLSLRFSRIPKPKVDIQQVAEDAIEHKKSGETIDDSVDIPF